MVVDVSANGIPGALVSWTPLQPEWIDGEVTWSDQNWQEVEATTVLTTAGPDGRYELPALPAGALAELSAVWATKPGFVAEAVVLDSTSSDRHLDIVLEPAEALEVVVLSGLGACVEGATVEYAADYDRDARGPEADPLERRAQLILRRTPVTGAEGIVMLPSYPDHFVVQARKDGMISDVLSRTEERRLTLSLKGTFSVRGSVRFAPGVSSEIPLHVDCRALEGSRLHRLARVPVDGEGRWSMHSIPLLVIDSYVFRLAAEGVALDEEHTGIPSAGDVVEVELEAWPGEAFAVHAVDDLGHDLAGANVAVYWLIDDTIHTIDLTTDPEGMCRTDECIPTDIWLYATAEGYLAGTGGPITLPAPELGFAEIVLQKAGMIRGRVLHLGQPVRDFEVAWMGPGNDDPVSQHVSDSAEGAFEFADVPPGEVTLMASSEGYAQSELVSATIDRDEAPEVVIELPEAIRGHGRVVSAETRAPVPEATILLFTCHRGKLLYERGSRYFGGPEGEFEVSGLNRGINILLVETEGYADTYFRGFGVSGEGLAFGEVALNRTQALTIQLLAEEPADFSAYSLSASGPEIIQQRSFPAAGELVCEDIAPGDWTILVNDPYGISRRINKRLAPGQDWIIQLHVQGSGQILVEVIPEPLGELPMKGVLHAEYYTEQGGRVDLTAYLPSDGKYTFPRFPTDSVSFTVFTPDWRVLGSASAQLEDRPEQTVRIQLGGHPLAVKVVDDLGEPVAGAMVIVSSLDAEGRWSAGETSGADGTAEFGKVAFEELLVHMIHPVRGSRVGVHIRPEELLDGLAELKLSGEARLEIPLQDDGVPCPHVPVLLRDPTAFFTIGEYTSDAAGTIDIAGLSEGPHRLALNDPRYWPSEHTVEASNSGSSKPVEIRRLGGLSIEVLDPGGVRVGGVPVELVSVEFGIPVAQWLSQGLVLCGESGLNTDLSGRIQVDGLPHGTYSWRIAGGSASGLGGEVIVPGGETGKLIVRLP